MTLQSTDLTEELALVIGGPATGKSTFLVQMYGRLQQTGGGLSLAEAPTNLETIRDGLARLSQGIPVRHTPAGVEAVQELLTEMPNGAVVRLAIPDYSGEAIDELVDDRRVSAHWRQLVTGSSRWFLFVRVEQMPDLPSLPARDAVPQTSDQARELPLDLRLVELLQLLRHERQRYAASSSPPCLTIVMSCWDEISEIPKDATPSRILRERIPLLASYATSVWPPSQLSILGLSAQGRALDDSEPDAEYVDKGPASMGYLIRRDGSTTTDLAELLTL